MAPKTLSTMRAPVDPLAITLQLKRLLLQVISEAAIPVSVRIKLCQLTPDRLVKCSVPCVLPEIANEKLSAFTEVQEYELPQPSAALTRRGALLAVVAFAITGEKSTELARAIAGMIATASTNPRTRPAFLGSNKTLETTEEQSRNDLQIMVVFPSANGASLRVAASDPPSRRVPPNALADAFEVCPIKPRE